MRSRILVLALGTFALGTDSFVLAGILPAIAHDLDVSVAVAGQLLTVFALFYALGSPSLAALTGTISRKRLLIISLSVFTCANVAAALAPTYAVLVVARAVAACSAALYTPTAAAAAAAIAPPEKRGRALALVTAGLTASLVLGVPLGAWIGGSLSWRVTFWVVVALAALATVGIRTLLPDVGSPPNVRLRARIALLAQPSVITALSFTVLGLAGAYTVYTYLAPLLLHETHLTVIGVSAMLLVLGLASVVGNLVGGHAADRWGARRTLVVGTILLGVALLVMPLAAPFVMAAGLVVVVWGVAGWLNGPAQQQRLLTLAPDQPAVILSLNASGLYLGIAIGAAVGGLVLQRGSFLLLGVVGALWQVGALTVLLWSTYQHPGARHRARTALDSVQAPRAPRDRDQGGEVAARLAHPSGRWPD